MRYDNESEIIFYQGEPEECENGYFVPGDVDDVNKARHYDNEKTWTIEAYDSRTIKRMIEIGAIEKKSKNDGGLFVVDAKQLIEFIAESSGLIVEFRNRRRAQLSPENAEKRRLRMAELNAQMRAKV